jgi:hypothetical protein
MTYRDFRTEVFNDRNLLRTITTIAKDRGVLCLHLLAKEIQRGFAKGVSDRELFRIEELLQQLCRMKNPDLYNIAKTTFY